MTQFTTFWLRLGNLISTIRISDIADILIVAYVIYKLIILIRRTNSFRLARGILVLLIALWLSGVLELNMVYRLLQRTVELGLIALVILFQPELRRLLERVGSNLPGLFGNKKIDDFEAESVIAQTLKACQDLSASKTGALIVFERKNVLEEQIRSGTVIDSAVSAELLKNLFFNKAPLHDGAVIIRSGRIRAAGCVLPLTGNINLSPDLGTRHRAGIGMSEQSDAVVVIVSEETGTISVAVDGMLKRRLTPDTFAAILHNEIMPVDKRKKGTILSRLFERRLEKKHEKNANDQ